MSNFEKKLEDAEEKDLYFWVNERDFRVVHLASDELTRRALKRLEDSIEKFDQTTARYNRSLIALTLILIVVALVQLITTIAVSPLKPWEQALIEVIGLGIILYAAIVVFKNLGKRNHKRAK